MEKVIDKLGEYSEGRRKILLYLWMGAQGILAALILIPGLRYLLQPLYEKVQTQRVQLGDFRAVPENVPTRVEYSLVQRAGYQVREEHEFVYVLRSGKQMTVFSPICTHMGCNVAWNRNAEEFQCPCHGGRYNKQGEVIAGPPPDPLQQFPSELQNGTVWITLGGTQQA
ncbi:MAG TPA: ubiquinol-cytochrome c reductase iron-sulfur subunit [bacterium]|nr:ubiquinol-cytochrome c reductase iron-sulfur subunit [bacterium]